MRPKLISSKFTGAKLMLLLFGLIILAPALFGPWSTHYFGNIALRMVVGLIITATNIYFLIKPLIVKFDDNYMYAIRGKQIQQIPLENVHKIKLTMTQMGIARFVWKIGYSDLNSETKSIRILPNMWNQNFEEFKQKVKQRNPSVKVRNWSHSFDFDQ